MVLMLLTVSAAFAAGPAPGIVPAKSGLTPSAFVEPKCPKTTSYKAVERGKAVRPQKLNELPPAHAYAAVLRHVGGCEVPVMVRYSIGGGF